MRPSAGKLVSVPHTRAECRGKTPVYRKCAETSAEHTADSKQLLQGSL